MNGGIKAASRGSLAAVAVLAVAACAPSGVSYNKDVQPILARNCSECHAPGQKGFEASGLDTTSHQSLLKGGKFVPLVKPGDALSSSLNMLVEGRAHSSIQMPHGRAKLPDKDIAILKVWVNEGAKNN
jgi:mono/diheme cytochrome c family protein